MRTIAVALAAILALSLPSRADDAGAKKLTLSECQSVREGLRRLDSYQGTDKDGKSAPMQYKLGALRLTIASDVMALDAAIRAGDDARMALVKENFPDGPVQPGEKGYSDFVATPAYKKFLDELQKNLNTPQSVAIPHISLSALKIGDPPDGNPIASDTLTLLAPVLDQ